MRDDDGDRFEREVMAEKWEEERAEHIRQLKRDDKIDFPQRAEMDAMVKNWSDKFEIQEREKEAGWIKFAAEMQVNIDRLNNLSIRSKK